MPDKVCAQKQEQDLSEFSSDLGTGDNAATKRKLQRKITGSTYTKKKNKKHHTEHTPPRKPAFHDCDIDTGCTFSKSTYEQDQQT